MNEEEDCDELKSDLRESCIFISEISLLKKKYTHTKNKNTEWGKNRMEFTNTMIKAEPDEICKTSPPTHMVLNISFVFSWRKSIYTGLEQFEGE